MNPQQAYTLKSVTNYQQIPTIFEYQSYFPNHNQICRDESIRSKETMDPEICDKLRNMINLTENFQAPIDGIDGLLGN